MNDDARHQPPKETLDRPASALTFVDDSRAPKQVEPRTRRPSATQPNTGEGFSSLRPIRSNEIGVMEGVLAMREPDEEDEKEGSSDGKEGASALEPEWTYPDGGLRAWLVVFGCWCFAASQLSTGMVWGVLVQYLHQNVYPDTPLSVLNVCGGLGNFVSSVGALLAGRLGDKYGYEKIIALGAVLFCITLMLSAFTYKNLVGLFLVQGCMLGAAIGFGFPLTMSMPSMWFKKRRGLATGIATSGTGFGGAILSLILRALLPRVGYRNTMLIWSAMNVAISIFAFNLIKTREPPRKPGESRVEKNWLPRGVWKDGAFYSLGICVFIGIFGYLCPFTFLVTYTTVKVPSMSSGLQPAIPLVIGNAASGAGRVMSGFLADRFGPVNMLFASFFVGGLLQAIFWPFADTYGKIIAFSFLYGLTASWFVSLLPVASAQLFGMRSLATITGFMVLVNAPGMFVGAVIGGVVLTGSGGSYKAVAYYGGGTMLVGAAALLYARFQREPRLLARF